MAVLALLSVIALRCALVVHSEEHATNASLDAYDDYDSARPPGQKRPPGQLLLQLQNRFMLADSQIAQVFKARHADPEKLSASMNHHIQLVKDVAHQYFEQFPADYVGGIDALGKGLFKDLSVPLKGHFSAPELDEFEKKWMEFFDEEASRGVGVRSNIGLYQQNGIPKALTLAIENVLEPLNEGVEEMVPEKTANEVVKFLQAFSDSIGALGESWACYETDRNPGQTVKNLDGDLTDALDQVLPEHRQTKDVRGKVKKNMDGNMEKLSKTALQNQKMVAEGVVCKKEEHFRKKKRPRVCPPGWKYAGKGLINAGMCRKGKGASLAQRGKRGRLDEFDDLDDAAESLGNVVGSLTELPYVELERIDDDEEDDDDVFSEDLDEEYTGTGRGTGWALSATELEGGAEALEGALGRKRQKIPASCQFGWTKMESALDLCYKDCPLTMTNMDSRKIIPKCKTLCQGKFSASGGNFCGENPAVIMQAKMKMVAAFWKAISSVFKFVFGLSKQGIQADSLKGVVGAFREMDGPFKIPKCGKMGLR